MNRQRNTSSLNFRDGLDTSTDLTMVDYVKIPTPPLDIDVASNKFCISAWVKPDRFYSSGDTSIISLAKTTGLIAGFGLKADDSKISTSIHTTNGGNSRSQSASGNSAIAEDTWVHITVCFASGKSTGNNSATLIDSGASWPIDELIGGRVWDDTENEGATITDNTATVVTGVLSDVGGDGSDWDTNDEYSITKVYVNGAVDTQTITDNTGAPSGSDTADTYLIGTDNSSERQFQGEIDTVLIYGDKWLTAAEVLRNYNATKGSHRN